MEDVVYFNSDGLKLQGVLHVPDDRGADERRPAFTVLHGFGGSKNAGTAEVVAKSLCDWGYVALRFDFRGCGDSEGTRGRILCHDQVADTRNAITWLAEREEVDASRIAVVGHSFGAAVAVYTGGVDERVAAVVSSCGWGDGARKFRGQHPTPEAWEKFSNMLVEGRRVREETGESLMVPRWDIVPIPEHLRGNLPSDANFEFPAETAQSMYDFKADDVVGNISPRPLMLLHGAQDSVTPTEQSLELFKRAGRNTELYLLEGTDHFPFAYESYRARDILKTWLDEFFPVTMKG